MKHLLIVYHSKTGHTEALAQAVYEGATDPQLDPVDVRLKRARDSGPEDLLWCDGVILGTPENFGYMSGALKDFFDRTFYEVEGKIAPLPYALFIAAGNDGRGAVRAIQRIANGYPLLEVQAPLYSRGEPVTETLQACRELGMALAAGLALGMF